MINLNEQQEKAKDLILKWWNSELNQKQIFVLAGYAGTGKTFLVNYIIKNFLNLSEEKYIFVAFTGKATSVLIQRGAKSASTIHKLIYTQVEKKIKTKIGEKEIETVKKEFIKKPSIPDYKLIILDEVSMVDEKILKDLMSFGIPILACGDLAQLEPIGKPNGLLDSPDFTLTQIVRQAEENAIIKLATMARHGEFIPCGNYGNAAVITKNDLDEAHYKQLLLNADQILCGTNRTRHSLNQDTKRLLGMELDKINKNEKIICLLNNWNEFFSDEDDDYPLVNGTIGNVVSFKELNQKEKLGSLVFKPDFIDAESEELIYDIGLFEADHKQTYDFHSQIYEMMDGSYEIKQIIEKKKPAENEAEYREKLMKYTKAKRDAISVEQLNFFDSAYAVSVHKSQGSEWGKVVLFDEGQYFNSYDKWLYTGITRAKNKLIIVK